MEIEGSVKEIFELQTFSSGFTKREFVITTQEQYPQDIKLELIKDRCDLIDPYKKGDQIKVQFNLRGNEYNGKYYVNLQAWRIEQLSNTPQASTPDNPPPFAGAEFPSEEPPMSTSNASSEIPEDDLPF